MKNLATDTLPTVWLGIIAFWAFPNGMNTNG
jgi:hypothetical protein